MDVFIRCTLSVRPTRVFQQPLLTPPSSISYFSGDKSTLRMKQNSIRPRTDSHLTFPPPFPKLSLTFLEVTASCLFTSKVVLCVPHLRLPLFCSVRWPAAITTSPVHQAGPPHSFRFFLLRSSPFFFRPFLFATVPPFLKIASCIIMPYTILKSPNLRTPIS